MSKRIKLTKGKFAIVDDADYARITSHRWFAFYSWRHWRAARSVNNKQRRQTIYMHHEVLAVPQGTIVDHRNRNGLDNRKKNLRKCTKAQNARNGFRVIRGKTSRYKGVCSSSGRVICVGCPWRATITKDGKQLYLGWYATQKEAAQAYDRAARQHFGEFAATNFS
jgi:hypothetical protein